ncbi:MAG: family protein phosphatase [Actinomycetota bacterium]|nr:family protein phosphatase [Actinomycetota bacterium]
MTDLGTVVAWGAASRPGPARATNEDAAFARSPIFAVADGMGGHVGGATASAAAVAELEALAGQELSADTMVRAIDAANGSILSKAERDPSLMGMGTTLAGVALVLDGPRELWLAFNIGDSRIYRLLREGFTQISVDHSLVQELVDSHELSAEDAVTDTRRNVVTRALGSDAAPEVDFWLLTPSEGERFLLCSDGVSGALSVGSLEQLLMMHHDPQEAAEALVAAAVEAGTKDDVTAVVVDTQHAPEDVSMQDTVTIERPRADAARQGEGS